MGAGGSIVNYAGASEDGGAKATTEATAHITAMGVDPESDNGKRLMQQLGALATFKNLMDEFHTEDKYNPTFPGGKAAKKAITADKEGDALMAAKRAISAQLNYRNLNGVYLVEKHHDEVFAVFMGIGPVEFEKKGTYDKSTGQNQKFVQIRRKDMVQKLTEAGVLAAQCRANAEGSGFTEEQIALGIKKDIKKNVDNIMKQVGREKSQSSLSEAQYETAMKKLVETESDNGLENWDSDAWTIKDPSKCPVAVAVKKDLDSLDTKGEYGINLHEWFTYWADSFACHGEERTLAALNGFAKIFKLFAL